MGDNERKFAFIVRTKLYLLYPEPCWKVFHGDSIVQTEHLKLDGKEGLILNCDSCETLYCFVPHFQRHSICVQRSMEIVKTNIISSRLQLVIWLRIHPSVAFLHLSLISWKEIALWRMRIEICGTFAIAKRSHSLCSEDDYMLQNF